MRRLVPGHLLLSAVSAKLWLPPAEMAAEESRGGPAQHARRGPSRAPAQRAFTAAAVMLVRQPLMAAPAAQRGAVRPNVHGTPFQRCRRHGPSATGDPAIRRNGHMDLT